MLALMQRCQEMRCKACNYIAKSISVLEDTGCKCLWGRLTKEDIEAEKQRFWMLAGQFNPGQTVGMEGLWTLV